MAMYMVREYLYKKKDLKVEKIVEYETKGGFTYSYNEYMKIIENINKDKACNEVIKKILLMAKIQDIIHSTSFSKIDFIIHSVAKLSYKNVHFDYCHLIIYVSRPYNLKKSFLGFRPRSTKAICFNGFIFLTEDKLNLTYQCELASKLSSQSFVFHESLFKKLCNSVPVELENKFKCYVDNGDAEFPIKVFRPKVIACLNEPDSQNCFQLFKGDPDYGTSIWFQQRFFNNLIAFRLYSNFKNYKSFQYTVQIIFADYINFLNSTLTLIDSGLLAKH